MQKQGRYLRACQSISLFYLWLGQRSEVAVDIKGNFNSMSFLLEHDNTGTLISYEFSIQVHTAYSEKSLPLQQ